MSYLALLITLLTVSPPGTPSLQRLFASDGSESVVEVLSISESGIEVLAPGDPHKLDIESVNSIRFSAGTWPPDDRLPVRLVDGSLIQARQVAVNEQGFIEILEDDTVRHSIDRRQVDYVFLVPDRDGLADRLQELLQSESRLADWLIFERNGALDYLQGQAGPVSRESVRFTTDSRTAEAPRSRVTAIAWFHATGRSFPDAIAVLTMVNGSQLYLRSLRRGDAARGENPESFVVQCLGGCELVLQAGEIFQIDFSAVRFRYLSELEPSTIEWNPVFYTPAIYEYQAALNGPRFDESYSGRPLSLEFSVSANGDQPPERVEYQYGLAVKGGTRLVYPLQGRYSRLQGWLGFAPDAPQDGDVEVRIVADGRELWRQVLKRPTDPPQELNLTVRNVNRLTVQVDYHDGRNIGDIIHFCDAKVIR
jgi:hypothetical protein